jgi:hypothetical protein
MLEKRITAKIVKPFIYNGALLEAGQEVEMNIERAVNHMRVGDVERNEEAIGEVKASRQAAAEAAQADAKGDW